MPLADDLCSLILDRIPLHVWNDQLTGLPVEKLAIHTGLPVQNLSLSSDIFPEADYLEYDLLEALNELPLLEALELRLHTQFVLSLCLRRTKHFWLLIKRTERRLQIPKAIEIPLLVLIITFPKNRKSIEC